MPQTWGELFDAYRRVWNLLGERLDQQTDDERQKTVDVMLNNARGLASMANLSTMVTDTLGELATRPFVDKRKVIEVVERVLHYDAKGYEQERREPWEQLRTALVTDDFHSVALRYVGMDIIEDKFDDANNHTDKAKPRIEVLAQQVIDSPDLLKPELEWLTTEEAKNGYSFGYDLGLRDDEFSLLPQLLDAQRTVSQNPSVFFIGGLPAGA